jgi:hypothetical protein
MLLGLTLAACTGLFACDAEDLLEPAGSPNPAVLPATGASGVTVMTRNIYLGFDIDGLLAGEMPLDAALAALQATDFPARAAALAAEIAATRPHLIGLQEVIDYRIEVPGDFLTNFTPDAATPLIPFLDILMANLQARGLDYEVAVNNPTTDVEVPMPIPGGYMDIRYTDHDVILVRGDVEFSNPTAGIYEAMITFDLGGIPGARPLGFAAVQAVANGTPLMFVTTHLETQSHPAIQVAQTAELLAWLEAQELPIVLVGDFNSAANANASADKYTATYGMLQDAGYQDLWLRGHGQDAGLTCCQAGDLLGNVPLDQRIDLIMLNGGAAKLVGGFHTAIVGQAQFQDGQPRWASDHAGVVAILRLPER